MDSEILGYVVSVATKITASASWCYLGVRLFDPARTQSAVIAASYGFARFLLGLCDPEVTVHMPGGTLAIEIDASFAVRLSGPVVRIGEGELSPECLEGA